MKENNKITFSLRDLLDSLSISVYDFINDNKTGVLGRNSESFSIDVDKSLVPEDIFNFLINKKPLNEFLKTNSIPDNNKNFTIYHVKNEMDVRSSSVTFFPTLSIFRPDLPELLAKQLLAEIENKKELFETYYNDNEDPSFNFENIIKNDLKNNSSVKNNGSDFVLKSVLYDFVFNKHLRKVIFKEIYKNDENTLNYVKNYDSFSLLPFFTPGMAVFYFNKNIALFDKHNIDFTQKPFSVGINSYNVFKIEEENLTESVMNQLVKMNLHNSEKITLYKKKNKGFDFIRATQKEEGAATTIRLNLNEHFFLKNMGNSNKICEKNGVMIRPETIDKLVNQLELSLKEYENSKDAYLFSDRVSHIKKTITTIERNLIYSSMPEITHNTSLKKRI